MAGLHRTRLLALALGTALASLAAAPTFAQTKTVISGGFDVGPGGFQANFNPISASAGFTRLPTHYQPLTVHHPNPHNIAGTRHLLAGEPGQADLHLQAGRRRQVA